MYREITLSGGQSIMDNSFVIVIPAFNEEAVLEMTLIALLREVPSHHVLVVSDGSTDKTSQIVNDRKINLLELPFNLGVGAAMRSGFQFAKENGFQKVIQFDADLQHQPKYINEIVSELDKYDVVVGSRFAANSSYKVSFVRSLAMGLLKDSVTRHIGKKMTDVTSGFRGANKKAIDVFADFYPSEYLADTVESLIIAHDKGLSISEIAVTMQERQGGMPSQNIFRSTLYLFRSILVIIATLTVKPRKDK
jgi:glycosyltransferase involved in cell wall biosynthesis